MILNGLDYLGQVTYAPQISGYKNIANRLIRHNAVKFSSNSNLLIIFGMFTCIKFNIKFNGQPERLRKRNLYL